GPHYFGGVYSGNFLSHRRDGAGDTLTVNLKQELVKGRRFTADESGEIVPSLYRPFAKQWLYFSRRFNERVLQMPRIFPDVRVENRVIMIKGNTADAGQIALMVDRIVDLQPDRGVQCFPLYLYDEPELEAVQERPQVGLFDTVRPVAVEPKRRDAILDEGLAHFQSAYPGEQISKEDVFYYVYGLLHSPDYRERYADNLAKELPRIPCVKSAADFWAFSMAGRELADLHVNYETVETFPLQSKRVPSTVSTM
ncbi:hypothetical protein JAO05_31005, partial [Burkholderia pseudomallei]|uniref:type ISP restriction/modification enzyme n=1 Tax=Burkholderia pseudomallei TaxID=28450 RepID=UPI001A241DAB|nr:hypothetical protein [Burkholderia pseudomallei]